VAVEEDPADDWPEMPEGLRRIDFDALKDEKWGLK
jgi:hypothetical protein